VFAASVQSVMMTIPCLHTLPSRRPSAYAAAASRAESDDQVHIPPLLLWFRAIVMTRFPFYVPPPLLVPLFALNLPRRLLAVADPLLAGHTTALLGMAITIYLKSSSDRI
jgi:hypothetical protein